MKRCFIVVILLLIMCALEHNDVVARKQSKGDVVGYEVYMPDGFMDGLSRPEKGGIIYRSVTADRGLNWNRPRILIKHNIARLGKLSITKMPWGSGFDLVMVISDEDGNRNYMSVSNDNGKSWKYPRDLNGEIKGTVIDISVKGMRAVIRTVRGDLCYEYIGNFLKLYDGYRPESIVCTGQSSGIQTYSDYGVLSYGKVCHYMESLDEDIYEWDTIRLPDGRMVYVRKKK